jgi:ribonuclease HII
MYESIFIGDIYNYHINRYLNTIELLNVMNVSKAFLTQGRKLLKPHICNTVIERLQTILGDKYKDFRQVLTDTGAVISGSFVLQCILGETWKSDIDIYISMNDNEKLYTDLSHKLKSKLCDYFYNNNFLYYTYEDIESYDINHKTKMIWVRRYDLLTHTYNVNNEDDEVLQDNINQCIKLFCDNKYNSQLSKYQRNKLDYLNINDLIFIPIEFQSILVRCNRDELIQFINTEFDFDICKNAFWFDQTGNPRIYINNLSNVVNKQTTFNYTINEEKSKNRKDKYMKRGFVFL